MSVVLGKPFLYYFISPFFPLFSLFLLFLPPTFPILGITLHTSKKPLIFTYFSFLKENWLHCISLDCSRKRFAYMSSLVSSNYTLSYACSVFSVLMSNICMLLTQAHLFSNCSTHQNRLEKLLKVQMSRTFSISIKSEPETGVKGQTQASGVFLTSQEIQISNYP